jgi:hypothetical protein
LHTRRKIERGGHQISKSRVIRAYVSYDHKSTRSGELTNCITAHLYSRRLYAATNQAAGLTINHMVACLKAVDRAIKEAKVGETA